MIYFGIGVSILLIIIIYSTSLYAFNNITLAPRHSVEECFERIEIGGFYNREDFYKLPREEVQVETSDGFNLKGIYIEKFKGSKKVIIIVHAYKGAYPYSVVFLDMFFKAGFNVLLIDQRAHGTSEGMYASYGFFEKRDLDLWVQWTRKRIGEDACIGLHGQSMGASTVLEYTGINEYVKFVIADCPYSDMKELLRFQFHKLYHAPLYPFIYVVNHRLKRKVGFSVADVSPINTIRDQEIPILFIHGSKDTFVPCQMSIDMYNVKKGYKRLFIVEGAIHCGAYGKDKEGYENSVATFLKEVLA